MLCIHVYELQAPLGVYSSQPPVEMIGECEAEEGEEQEAAKHKHQRHTEPQSIKHVFTPRDRRQHECTHHTSIARDTHTIHQKKPMHTRQYTPGCWDETIAASH